MSDDLVKRLRFGSLTTMGSHRMNLEAAARIEALEAQVKAATNVAGALMNRLIIYCGGEDMPLAGQTDLDLIDRCQSALAQIKGG